MVKTEPTNFVGLGPSDEDVVVELQQFVNAAAASSVAVTASTTSAAQSILVCSIVCAAVSQSLT